MRYTISSQQFDHLRRERSVALAELFSKEETDLLHNELDKALALKTGPGDKSLQEEFLAGRDLERENPPLKKSLHLSKLGQIAAPLFQKKMLRLAFTQYMLGYPSPATLEEISSVTEVCGGLILSLTGEEAGSGLFIHTDFPLEFPIEAPSLLLAFSTEKARYRQQKSDPHTNALKKLGYGFGDRLTVETHPLIIR